MAAYGALVSVMQIMDQLHRHPHPPISLHKEQSESLTANLTFLQEFLEGYNPHVSYTTEADPLESRIAEAAYAAEDVIESYIVDQIHVHARPNNQGRSISSIEFYQGLQKVIEEMDVIKMEIKEEKMEEKKETGVQILKKSMVDAGSSGSSSALQKVAMVGCDGALYEMLDKITGGGRVRQIIPIVGMGGLGKTTLARNIYANQLVKEHFDIRAWSTISQVHNARKILSEILAQVSPEYYGDLSESELGVTLYKHLIGKRYLIVMDDIWNIEAWDRVRSFFPESEKGSRVLVTTRLSNLASKFNDSDCLDMKFLDESSSWKLFCITVFGEEICPLELEEIGKKIVKGCRGLPLSIVVIGGLLSKSEPTPENWEVIKENLNSSVNSEDNGRCLQILYMSYNNLPIYIKPCFLYMSCFGEDASVAAFMLVQLWVAEGFIKPIDGKSLEEAAEEYIKELVDRNLFQVEGDDLSEEPITYKIHDLLLDLCLREAGKMKFLCVLEEQSIHDFEQSLSSQRRLKGMLMGERCSSPLILQSLESASHVRTLLGNFPSTVISGNRLLRIGTEEDGSQTFVPHVNLRLVFDVEARRHPLLTDPHYKLYLLWNLHTLFIGKASDHYTLELWRLPLLRYVMLFDGSLSGRYCLPDRDEHDPHSDDQKDEVVLENLHTLGEVSNLKLGEGVLRTIPNIKFLMLSYSDSTDDYCLNNLRRLNKLQELHLTRYVWDSLPMQDFILPYSLEKLTLKSTNLPWEEMGSKIGCLPLLQVLQLQRNAFVGSEWETVEGQFSSLRVLLIKDCRDLEQWTTDNTHFPRLEHLGLRQVKALEEIPSSIGDISTLRSIKVEYCSDSVAESARRILKEQEEMGNEDIKLQVEVSAFF